jgi:hypothetical protein
VPTHLLTREALELYLRKVNDGGVVFLHVSNRALDLRKVLRGWSRRSHQPVAICAYLPSDAERKQGAMPAVGAAIAPAREQLEALIASGKWRWLEDGPAVDWSDDSIDLLHALTVRPYSIATGSN